MGDEEAMKRQSQITVKSDNTEKGDEAFRNGEINWEKSAILGNNSPFNALESSVSISNEKLIEIGNCVQVSLVDE